MRYSLSSEFPFLKLRSIAPARALLNWLGMVPAIKSDTPNTYMLKALIPPPEDDLSGKWLGFTMSAPSNLHNTPRGEFPRTTMVFSLSCAENCTPGRESAILPGSLMLPANRWVSSTLNDRALNVTNPFKGSDPIFFAVMTTASAVIADSIS